MPSLPDPLALLPHRYPFLLVDRITAVEPGVRAEGIKRVTSNEWFVGEGAGTTSPAPEMPHALVVEALAQLSAAVLAGLTDAVPGAIGYFLGADRVRYRSVIMAGDELRLAVQLTRFRRGVCRTRGDARVGSCCVVRADLTIVIRAADAPGISP